MAILPRSGHAAGTTPVGTMTTDDDLLLSPTLARGTSGFAVGVRPFFNALGPGWGAISDVTVDHLLVVAPLRLSATMSPLALAVEPGATGMITHLRIGVSFVTQFVEVGFGAGGRFQHFGRGGFSLAGGLRLGAGDGLYGRVDLVYALVRNYYSGQLEVALSSALATFEVPLSRRLALVAEGGASFDAWIFATTGLRHHLGARGQAGTWSVRGGVGVAWVLDHFPCQYGDPRPCEGAAWATGPTMGVGFDRRF